MPVLVVVGAGPRGTGLLERIAANAPELLSPDVELDVHLVDPHPPGGGRIWRHEQSPLLRMNSMAEDVTMFTDERTSMDGPVRPGPSLAEWAADPAAFAPRQPERDPEVAEELDALAATDFPTRRAQSAYLDWVFHRSVAELPDNIRLFVHRDTVRRITGDPDGPQRVHLSDTVLLADRVVLALGHLDSAPGPETAEARAFAARHGRSYLPPAFTADSDLSGLAPGERVIVRGLGLAFVDLVALLTEGRGGRFTPLPGGGLRYHPSGREPVLYAGSRRGVPYHAKTGYRLQGPPPALPRYFGPDLRLPDGPVEFRRDLWPAMAKEIGYGYYHELFHGHPERTALPWPEFLDAYDRLDWHSPARTDLVAAAVPDPEDRLDLDRLDRPLTGLRVGSPEELQQHLHAHLRADLARRSDLRYSADLGAFFALLSLYGQLIRLLPEHPLTARSTAAELDGWWTGFFSFYASGPPGFRLEQLLALADAGLLHFLGPDTRVELDEQHGTFRASSPALPDHHVHGTALVDAFLPRHALDRTADPLLRQLLRDGRIDEERLTDPDGHTYRSGLLRTDPDARLLDPALDGRPHPRRTALGAPTTTRAPAAFARPRTDAPSFRQNDAVARRLLTELQKEA
ncbi:FAD/NAD(P)-binding domain-containing protein [Streptomyces sp. TLI_171]|uniref:FAD/NAD(P)-binding protein n=1 Tax=Streptomyces sp. TLI_171 TaxID=1938859 RepID=UPI000C1952EE|nr:FAD/NAD(P)-binding protein [Streptomyces sp. TLI_171]RKE21111.1 FAD-NAD(P)-binding protein [Streptomyces sp. TLI_171]